MSIEPSFPPSPKIYEQQFFDVLSAYLEETEIALPIISDTFPLWISWDRMNLRQIIKKTDELENWTYLLTRTSNTEKQTKMALENYIKPHLAKAEVRLTPLLAKLKTKFTKPPFNLSEACSTAKEIYNGLGLCLKWRLQGRIGGDTDRVRVLLKAGANIEAVNVYGETALVVAARVNNAEIVRELIKLGTDLTAIDRSGWNAFMWAVHNSNEEMIKALLDFGANPNATDKNGATAIMVALRRDAEEKRQLFLKQDPKKYNIIMDESSFYRVHFTTIHIVRELIDRGVSLNIVNNNGETALDIAEKAKNEHMVKVLHRYDAPEDSCCVIC